MPIRTSFSTPYDRDERKKEIARRICASTRIRVSPQVLMEASSNLTQRFGFEKREIEGALRYLLPILHPISSSEIERTWFLMSRCQFSIWDAAIVAAALSARCTVLYSEDFQHGQVIDRLRIINPFA